MTWSVDQADCLDWLNSQPEDSADLVFGSGPYEDCRTYGIGFALKGQAWVDWMVAVFRASLRVCTGLVACVVEGKTEDFQYSCTPALLMADLHRAGICLRKPPIFHRVGIPGSGGPDWLRNDWEWIICATRGGELPWSDNTACGHAPKWAPGGEMSHRLTDGTKVNQWGGTHQVTGRNKHGEENNKGDRPSHILVKAGSNRRRLGTGKRELMGRRVTRGVKNGDTKTEDAYCPPAIANPGNVISLKVGGGLMGSKLAHLSEAPFPESLVEVFVLSFCKPGGTIIDPFCGSGTSGAVAVKWGRNFRGCDIRQSQVDNARRRISGVTPMLFV